MPLHSQGGGGTHSNVLEMVFGMQKNDPTLATGYEVVKKDSQKDQQIRKQESIRYKLGMNNWI